MCPRPATQNTPHLIIAFDEENQKPTRETPNQVSTHTKKSLLKRLVCPFANQHIDQDVEERTAFLSSSSIICPLGTYKQEDSLSYKLKANLGTSFIAPAASLMYDVFFGVYNVQDACLDMSTSLLYGPSSRLDPEEIDQSIDLGSLLSLSSEGFFCGNDKGISSQRLDEEITQIDIAQMNHMTAQQFGLESISSLPIVSYEECVIPESDTSVVIKQEARKKETQSQNDDSNRSPKAATPPGSTDDVSNDPEQAKEYFDLCAICHGKLVDGDLLRRLPCQHFIHIGCIERFALLSDVRELNPGKAPEAPWKTRTPPGCSLCTDHSIEHVTTSSIQASEISSLSSNSNSKCSIPSWSFVQVGGSLEGDEEVDLSSHDEDSSIPSWSFERLGDILDQQGRT